MRIKKKHRPKPWQWRLESLGHSLLEGIVCRLPGSWAFHLGEILGGFAWHLLPQRRRIVIRNLRIALAGEKTLTEIQRMAKQSFRRSGASLICAAHTARLSPSEVRRVVTVENLHLLEQAQARGQGVVLLLAHMGNWELLTKLVHIFPRGSKCGAFYRPLNNPLLDARILRRRKLDGTRMFSKRDPFHQVTGFLREGGIVGILADQRVGRHGEMVPFFGRFTSASPLPSLLARRAKSEVLSLSLETVAPGKWKAILQQVPSPPTTTQCMAALEQAMRCSLVDVFWLQERWKIYASSNHGILDWFDADMVDESKPCRVLLWLEKVPESWSLPEVWIHPYLRYEAVLVDGKSLPPGLPSCIKVHRISPQSGRKQLLLAIEADDALPLDFVISPVGDSELAAAAASASIPLIFVS
ncbi:MAG: lysophospholipid acyltransferase family protein [Verrucomicrobiota bacterium]